jgi:dual-specificity kinase
VLECWDRWTKEYVAVKVVRTDARNKYGQAAHIEISVLQSLGQVDAEGRHHCVRLRRHFMHRGHTCLVFDKLGLSLFDFLRKNSYQPFPVPLVAQFGCQLLDAMQFMHSQKLVHTDLKPENILLQDSSYEKQPAAPGSKVLTKVPTCPAIWLIDFGSATWEEQYHSTVVSTRHYRAPEVILGLGWSYPCDVWSLGCILLELLTGEALFQTHENIEHLAMMEVVLGPIPVSVACRADHHARKYFRAPAYTELRWPEGSSSRDSVREVRRQQPLGALVAARVSPALAPLLTDLLAAMLRFDPKHRITAAQALQHPFFAAVVAAPPANAAAPQQQQPQPQPMRPPPPPRPRHGAEASEAVVAHASSGPYPSRGCAASSADRADDRRHAAVRTMH